MDQELQNHFEEFEKPLIIRRKLLPWWIKTFCWIFMIMGTLSTGTLVASAFLTTVNLSLYGFTSSTAYSGVGIFIIAVMLLKGFAAYSLWFEKSNAITIAKIDAIVGIVVCVSSMFINPNDNGNFSLRLEIFLLIPYYIKINKIEYEWDNLETI
ncbi:hypothetical protein ASE21_10250 [Flavobacterium sp. Root901]|uniref:hypothetical protein n=1 Tax=Flavobacterium sp. Root901 TaxID=1736605 RepID=UPI000708B5D5|nr:hypothetical protein [Flavobacterium sp. Root901]KRD10094.1 hypothetical protein ASE21_10250 [Flavobacterium sp. Root901]